MITGCEATQRVGKVAPLMYLVGCVIRQVLCVFEPNGVFVNTPPTKSVEVVLCQWLALGGVTHEWLLETTLNWCIVGSCLFPTWVDPNRWAIQVYLVGGGGGSPCSEMQSISCPDYEWNGSCDQSNSEFRWPCDIHYKVKNWQSSELWYQNRSLGLCHEPK